MFVLIEKESFKREPDGEIIEDGLRAWSEVHETIKRAIASTNMRMVQLSKCHDDYVKISDTKCKYTYVGMESYSEFLIAKIEIVPPEENLDV